MERGVPNSDKHSSATTSTTLTRPMPSPGSKENQPPLLYVQFHLIRPNRAKTTLYAPRLIHNLENFFRFLSNLPLPKLRQGGDLSSAPQERRKPFASSANVTAKPSFTEVLARLKAEERAPDGQHYHLEIYRFQVAN